MDVALFQSRQAKEARLMAEHARQILHRRKDVVSESVQADVNAHIDRLETVAKTGDKAAIKEATDKLDKAFARVQPNQDNAGWRENCEVLLTAFVLAIAIRAYFLQPFKIPTGSMQPTLNGIIGHPVPGNQPLPGFVRAGLEKLWLGRTYVNVVAEGNDRVASMTTEKGSFFRELTLIKCASGREYRVNAPKATLQQGLGVDGFGVYPGREYRAGEPIAHGYIDTGDQVFVDKFTYHFRQPRRADVFVFSTRGLPIPMGDPNVQSEFYIKRIAGQGGDTLRVVSPRLYRNGQLAPEPGFQRVMRAADGYRGYSNPPPAYEFRYLLTPDDTFTVPKDFYFAMGDNSYNSSDSRKFGPVPAQNVVGRGLFVYWPFTRHWGLIK